MTRRFLWMLSCVALWGCGPPTGELKIEVDDDGTVRIELVSEGEAVRGTDLYVQVRGVRTQLLYAAATTPVDSLCEQLPTSGPLRLRLSAPPSDCPEIHAAAYRHEPPEPEEGEASLPDVPLSERCSTYQSLLSTLVWSDATCVRSVDGGIRDAAVAPRDAAVEDAHVADAGFPDIGAVDAGAADAGGVDATSGDSGPDDTDIGDGGVADGA